MSVKSKAELKDLVRQSLKLGEAQAIPGKLLAQRLEERDTRRIRLAIIDLIVLERLAIVGDSARGYYYAETTGEAQKALDTLQSYLNHVSFHRHHLLHACEKLLAPEQLKLGIEIR